MNDPHPARGQDSARRPRLRRGLAVVRVADGLLLEGGPRRQFLTGAAASSVLTRLLPSLDGSSDRTQICAELSLSQDQFDHALSMLDGCGLLEWVRPDGGAGFGTEHVATYMSRTVSTSDSFPSADDLAGYLASAAALLVAPPALTETIAEDLKETGVGSVGICTAREAASAVADTTDRCVAAVFDDPGDEEVLARVVAACKERDLPVIRFSGKDRFVEVGPVFGLVETTCLRCFRRSPGLMVPVPGEPSPAGRWTSGSWLNAMLSSLMTSALLGLLTRQAPVPQPSRLTRITVPGYRTELYDVVPDLDCATCGGGTPPQDQGSRDLLAYEWRMAKTPSLLIPLSRPAPAEDARPDPRESFRASPRHRLPAPAGVGPPTSTEPASGLDDSLLATILAGAAGYRSAEDPDRTMAKSYSVPCGGTVASVAIYLSTENGLFSLPGTIFRYDDIEHQVLSVSADRVALARILDGTDLDAAATDVVIMLVGEVGLLRQKYDQLAWRQAHLDAGCATLQLHLAATALGVGVTFASRWPAQLAEMLELDPLREVITAVAGICVRSKLNGGRSSSCP